MDILLVKIKYGSQNWTLPVGHLDSKESPIDGVKREVLEETGFIVVVGHLISLYSAPEKDDLVLLFKADITDQVDWTTNDEIDQVAFFHKDTRTSSLESKKNKYAYQNHISNLWIFT